MYKDFEKHWYWLASAPNVGMKTMVKILGTGVSLAAFFENPEHKELQKLKLNEKIIANIKSRADEKIIDAELYELTAQGISVCTMLSKDYPALLKEINSPPLLLYVKGDLGRLTDKRMTIVGSRRASRRGLAHIEKIAEELASAGVSVISGMARGIDTAAHKGALKAGGVSVAVLGCGVDIVYPRENEDIYDQMVATGAVVSEYKPGTDPVPGNFPVRNRIMAGISGGLLVGDAGVKSGAHITVRQACEENRDVFAVPTEPGVETYELPNILIEDGAYVCRHSKEILNFYGWKTPEDEVLENLAANGVGGLDFFEAELYNLLLKGDTPLQELIDVTGHTPQEINLALTMLELKGVVVRLAGNIFGIQN